MSRKFKVYDLSSDYRHFDNLENAIEFAASQARQAFQTPEWSIKVNGIYQGRIAVDGERHFTILSQGQQIGAGDLVFVRQRKGARAVFSQLPVREDHLHALGR